MSHSPRGPVVIDTGVFGSRLTPSPRGRALTAAYRPLREGRPAVISFVIVAELRFGATLASIRGIVDIEMPGQTARTPA